MDVTYQVKRWSRHGDVFALLLGDLTEGKHHDTIQVLTDDIDAHAELAIEVLTPLLQHVKGCAFVRGTPAHGNGTRLERKIALHFSNRGLVPGEFSPTHPVFKREVFGKLINAAHHTRGGTTRRLRKAAMLTLLERATMQALRDGVPVADYYLRGHTHFFTDTEGEYKARGIAVPCWQLPTEFVNKISPDSLPDIGAVAIRGGNVIPLLYPILKEDRLYPKVELGKT